MKTFDEAWKELFRNGMVAFIKNKEGRTIPVRGANRHACEYFWNAALRAAGTIATEGKNINPVDPGPHGELYDKLYREHERAEALAADLAAVRRTADSMATGAMEAELTRVKAELEQYKQWEREVDEALKTLDRLSHLGPQPK